MDSVKIREAPQAAETVCGATDQGKHQGGRRADRGEAKPPASRGSWRSNRTFQYSVLPWHLSRYEAQLLPQRCVTIEAGKENLLVFGDHLPGNEQH